MSGFIVALCDLQPRDARLLEIVLCRAPNRRFDFRIVSGGDAGYADVAIIDADNPELPESLGRLRGDSPELVEVYVSESGAGGSSKYKIAKKSLVLHCFRLLESIAENKMRGNLAGSSTGEKTSASEQPSASAVIESNPPARTDALKLRGLVVDDSETVRTQLEVTLQRCGLAVETAAEGETALAKLQSGVFDLVFLDVVMPGINGYDLCRKIRAIPNGRHLPVLMLTSRSSPFDRARGALAGCDTYLTKPVTLKDFYQGVHKSLSKRFSEDELAARGYRRLI